MAYEVHVTLPTKDLVAIKSEFNYYLSRSWVSLKASGVMPSIRCSDDDQLVHYEYPYRNE